MPEPTTSPGARTATAEADPESPEIIVRRVFRAPRDLVFAAWTEPERLDQWYGPEGFTNHTKSFDFRVGGTWRYSMIGPDGTDYPNRLVYREIDPPRRLAYDNGWDRDPFEPMFHAVVTFTARGDETEIEMRSVFPSVAARDHVIRGFGALQGGKDTLDRLAAFVEAK